MKFYIHTTGCKANQWDSYIIQEELINAGMKIANTLSQADLIVINACTVTEGADRDIRRFINRCRRLDHKGKIILVGCQPQAHQKDTFGVDLILGQNEKYFIKAFISENGNFIGDRDKIVLEEIPKNSSRFQIGKTRFFFKIQDGCNRFCSYCIVPYARGIPRSRPLCDVLGFLKVLKERGIKEVVLTGIEISEYRDPLTGAGLNELLRQIEGCETPERIRLSSIDPLYMDDEFINIISESKKIAKSLHIPLQSGSDRILAFMNRHYSQTYIRNMLGNLNKKIPDIGIGIDVIVGFPAEDEEDFEKTYNLLDTIGIYYLHVFPFSARPGTVAASMNKKVPEHIIKERVRRLKNLDAQKREAFYTRFVGTERQMIVEGKLYKNLYMRGYTENYIPVYIPYDKLLENRVVKVKIMGVKDGMVMGKKAEG